MDQPDYVNTNLNQISSVPTNNNLTKRTNTNQVENNLANQSVVSTGSVENKISKQPKSI